MTAPKRDQLLFRKCSAVISDGFQIPLTATHSANIFELVRKAAVSWNGARPISYRKHTDIKWDPHLKEWFCSTCGRTSDHTTLDGARIEIEHFEYALPSINSEDTTRRSLDECTLSVEELLTELRLCPGVGVAILDDQLRFQAVNPALAQMNGVTEIQHLGKTIADVLGDFEHQVSPLVREVLASGRPLLHCDLSGMLPTRREKGYWVSHYFPLKDSSGRIARLGAVVLEVTPQRKVDRVQGSCKAIRRR